MAQESVTILRVDTGEAVSSVGELKAYIKDLKGELDTAVVGTDNYTDTLTELNKQQTALRAVMAGSVEGFKIIQEGADNGTQSYNSLVKEMAALRAEWRATTDETRRNELGEQINGINDQLKALDSQTGSFQRNVGDYTNAMVKGFQQVGGGAMSLINPLKNVQGAMNAVSSTPFVAILGLIATLIVKVIDNLKKSEQGMMAMTEAFAAFSVIGDLVTKALEGLGKALTTVVGWIGEMTAAIIGNNEAMEDKLRLAKLEKEMLEEERINIRENAEAEKESAELRAKAVDKLTYSAKERIAFLEKAGQLEMQIAERNKKAAEKEYEAWKLRNKPTESAAEDKRAEAEAYAKMLKAQTAYFNKTKEMVTQLNEAKKQERDENTKRAKAAIAQAEQQLSAERELTKQLIELAKQGSAERLELERKSAETEYRLKVTKAQNTIENKEQLNATLFLLERKYRQDLANLEQQYEDAAIAETKQAMTNRMNMMRKGSYEQLAAALELKRYELETIRQMDSESDESYKARQIKLSEELRNAQSALVDQQINEHKTDLERRLKDTEEGSLAQLQLLAEQALYNWQTTYQGLNEAHEDYLYRKAEAERAYRIAEEQLTDYDQYKVDLQNQLELLEFGSMEHLTLSVKLKEHELDTIHQLEYESEEAFQRRMIRLEQSYNREKKALANARVNIAIMAVDSVSGLLSGIADYYEADTNASEEELRKAKNLKVAGAILDTIAGATAALTSPAIQSLGPIGWVLAAIQAATITMAGMANVRQLQSTEINKNSSGSTASAGAINIPASVSATAPTLDTQIESVRTITTAKEEEKLNQSQKVYLVMDDLEIAQNSRRARTTEATF